MLKEKRGRNIENVKAIRHRHYLKNKESIKKKILERKVLIKVWLHDYKSKLKCSKCPENHISCLDFHHKDPKNKEVSIADAIKFCWSIKRILKEIEKCDVLCSNCHRKEHFLARTV